MARLLCAVPPQPGTARRPGAEPPPSSAHRVQAEPRHAHPWQPGAHPAHAHGGRRLAGAVTPSPTLVLFLARMHSRGPCPRFHGSLAPLRRTRTEVPGAIFDATGVPTILTRFLAGSSPSAGELGADRARFNQCKKYIFIRYIPTSNIKCSPKGAISKWKD